MSFNANIDIAISFTHLKMCSLRQQGLLKFRVCLFHTNDSKQQKNQLIFCHPYNIMKDEKEKKNQGLTLTSNQNSKIQNPYMNFHHLQNQQKDKEKPQNVFKNNFHKVPTSSKLPTQLEQTTSYKNQSQLDLQTQFYYSKSFQVLHEKQSHSIKQTCLFRTYVDTQHFQDIELRCLVQILFCPQTSIQENNAFKTIARCECKIRKIYDVSTYLPLVFDQFDGVTLDAIYQASLMDFRFQKSEEQSKYAENNNFFQYVQNVTSSFKRYETRQFYKFYRGILQKQLIKIQERHYDLLRVMNLLKKDEDFRRIRMNPNGNIMSMIDHLQGYNHHGYNHSSYGHAPERYGKRSVESSYRDLYSNRQKLSTNSSSSRSFKTFSSQSQLVINPHEELCDEILKDLLAVKAQIFQKWTEFLQFIQHHLRPITEKYKESYNILVKQRLSGNVFSHRIMNSDWKLGAYEDSGKQHLKQAELDKKKFEKDEELWKETFPVDNQAYFTKDNKTIKIFEQVYEVNRQKLKLKKMASRHSFQPHLLHQNHDHNKKSELTNSENENIKKRKSSLQESCVEDFMSGLEGDHEDHYIVLVHGYQASRQDFILFKNCLQIKFKVKVYISTCNEGRTQDPLQVMGKRLAVQLQNFLNRSERSMNYKLSFIGHSMGGLIVRTALCYLQNIDRHLYSYITFSAPHLGYLYNPSTHIQAGLWFMNAWQKSDSIEELCMRDSEDLRSCFLFKLSKSGSLNSFKNIALIGSCQDKYVPFQSARIQQNSTLISEKLSSSDGHILKQMIEGLLEKIKCRELSRMDIVFNIEDSNFDSVIGRTGHVKFLSDRQFIKLFCIVFQKYFK